MVAAVPRVDMLLCSRMCENVECGMVVAAVIPSTTYAIIYILEKNPPI